MGRNAESDGGNAVPSAKVVAVRHVSGDRLVAVVEVVSPGHKSGESALRAFVVKAADLLEERIHLLILDLHPSGGRDPQGIHGLIWENRRARPYGPPDNPLPLAAYESGLTIRAFVVHATVGDALTDMPLFLEPQHAVMVPLEATYQAAFVEMPERWKRVLEPTGD